MSARNTYFFLGGLLLLVALRLLFVWDALPAHMASHFGPSGAPNGWASKSEFFVIFAITLLVTPAILLIIPATLRSTPDRLISLPNKDYWLAPERRAESIERLASFGRVFAVTTTLFTAMVLEMVIQANLHQTGLSNGPFMFLFFCYLGFTAIWTVQLIRGFAKPARPA